MRILLVGAGGVGAAFARIAARRPFAELVIADYDLGRPFLDLLNDYGAPWAWEERTPKRQA